MRACAPSGPRPEPGSGWRGVEVDGAAHDQPDQLRHDERRAAWLAAAGVCVLRVTAADISRDMDAVLVVVRHEAGGR